VLLVVASEGEDEAGRNRLALVRVPADRAGVSLRPLPPVAFVPEVGHAALRLCDVRVEPAERLPGDGYERYLKPFRTVEDCHVHGALCGWLLQVGRRCGWPRAVLEEVLLLLCALRPLALAPPGDAAVHVALGGVLAGTARLLRELEPLWQQVEEETRRLWERDRPLLSVAGRAREQRLAAAWERLGGPAA